MRCILLGLIVFLLGCESARFGAREKGALTGAGLGAGLGAIVGNQFGRPGAGVAIGSGLGALAGGVVGEGIDRQDQRLAERDRRLLDQERELAENRRILEELRARGQDARITDRGVVVNLPDVLFEFDSSRLTPSARRTIADIRDVLRDYRGRKVTVEGHTDSVGSDEYNERLSYARARAVADQLGGDVEVRGFGERRPIASNSTADGRARNRRVEVIIGD
jgi:outer membrane protein OmpA-like peptidoglycan-associated protein